MKEPYRLLVHEADLPGVLTALDFAQAEHDDPAEAGGQWREVNFAPTGIDIVRKLFAVEFSNTGGWQRLPHTRPPDR